MSVNNTNITKYRYYNHGTLNNIYTMYSKQDITDDNVVTNNLMKSQSKYIHHPL